MDTETPTTMSPLLERELANLLSAIREAGPVPAGGGTGSAVNTGDLITAAKMNLKLETLSDDDEDPSDFTHLQIPTSGSNPAGTVVYVGHDNTGDMTLNALTGKAVNVAIAGTDEFTFDATAFTVASGNRIDYNAAEGSYAAFLRDVNNNELLDTYATASAVNGLAIRNAATGDAPIISAEGTGAEADIGILFHDSNGNELLELRAVASAVNQLAVINAATTARPRIRAEGEGDLGMVLSSFDGTNDEEILILVATATAVNEVTVTSAAAGSRPTITATGDDTDIDLALTAKGTGAVRFTTPFYAASTGTFAGATTWDGNVDTVINITSSPIIDIGPDVFPTGTFIDVAFDTAETLTGALTGVALDFNTNVTAGNSANVVGFSLLTPAHTQSAAVTTTYFGFNLPTAGALVQDTAAGTLDWRGVNIQLPSTTETTGTVTAYGVRITEGTTTSGAVAGLYVDVDIAIDLVTLGNRIDLDADNDTSIRASADDVVLLEIAGVDAISFNVNGSTARIQAGTAAEIGISVTNADLTVGSLGSVVIPYTSTTDNAMTDAKGGDIDGAIAINHDTDGPTSTFEARVEGAWLSVAVSGYLMQARVPWSPDSTFLAHPAQVYQADDRWWIDESRCFVCGEKMQPGEQLTFWANGPSGRGVHAIFGHTHLEKDPVVQQLLGVVDVLAKRLGYSDAAAALGEEFRPAELTPA